MSVQKYATLNRAKCLQICLSVCEIQGYWAAYAAKKGVHTTTTQELY